MRQDFLDGAGVEKSVHDSEQGADGRGRKQEGSSENQSRWRDRIVLILPPASFCCLFLPPASFNSYGRPAAGVAAEAVAGLVRL